MEQEIHFCTTADGVRIAYATAGQGPPLVKAANWLNHIEFDWQSPIWRHILENFASDHLLVRYDERGNGLSDWNVDDLSFEAFVRDLESVVDTMSLDRFPILGISQGGPVAIAYAVRHPEKVSHLILYGSYARGWAKRSTPEQLELRQAQLTLIKHGWGQDNAAFRQMWTSLYLPDGTPEQWQWFNEMQRISASPENALRLMTELGKIDVVDLLPQVRVPTLVLHCRDDAVVPFEAGRLLASAIPGARLIPLEGKNHLPLETDPAWLKFVTEVRGFLGASRVPMGRKSAAPPVPNREGKALAIGDSLGRYTIKSLLGEGGMGQVYLAEDTQLRRRVALKVLPADLAASVDRMRRFVQEAQAAAALNHPNIAHIYEIGEHDTTSFIAMEYVDGYTLRQLIHDRRTDLAKLLRWLQHVAEGLAKAHAAGIVHRDLKPDNIMVTREGHAKILDFGLAKLIEPQGSDSRTSDGFSEVATAILQHHSTPGAVLGTVGYMSPEQAHGKVNEIDHRSDVFSFGCILYEAITGRKAFEGKDTIDSLNQIIREQPAPIATHSPNAPADLQRIVRRCLAKDPEERYQTVKDVAIEIKDVRRELQSAGLDTTVPPPSSDSSIRSGIASVATRPETSSLSSSVAVSTHPSSAEYIVEGIKRNKKLLFAGLGLIAIAIAAVAFAIYYFVSKPKARFERVKLARITTEGNLKSVGVSPDGKYIAYSLLENGKYSLWTKHLATGSRVQIVAPTEANGMAPHFFSHDGSYVYYYQLDEQNPQGVLFQVAVLGGDSKKILTNVQSGVALSPDGSQLAFGRYLAAAAQQYEIWLANADGSNLRKLYAFGEPAFWSGYGLAWSPDGKLLTFDYGSEEGGEHMTIGCVAVNDAAFKVLTSQRWLQVGRMAWYPDGSGMAVVAGSAGETSLQLWEVTYPGGAVRRITNDLHSYGTFSLTLTSDSQTLVALQEEISASIWVMPDSDSSRGRALTSRKGVQDSGCEWTPDGRIVFGSNVSGEGRVWIMNADGSEQKPLTDAADESGSPIASPDGRYIFFSSLRSKTRQIWRMELDGSSPKQVTDGTSVGYFAITPDGKWILYSLWTPGLWKVSVDGGAPVRILDAAARGAEVSPDGKLLAYDIQDIQTKRNQIVIINYADLTPVKTFNPSVTIEGWRWAPDSRALILRDRKGDVSNLWRHPIDGALPTQITDFKSEVIRYFSYSQDGKHLVMSRGSVTRDAVLITEEK